MTIPQSDPPREADHLLAPLAKETERIEEDCLYSAKGHYEAGRIWGRWNLLLGVPAALLGAGAGASGFSDLPLLAGGLAVFSAVFAAILTFLKPNERTSVHQQAGAR